MDKNQKEKNEYISLFEAAKKSGYAQDYLSLLCRQGKLKGEKMGRNWVTTYQWLDEYQQNLISDVYTKTGKNLKVSDASNLEGIGSFRRSKLVLAASLFFLILLGGFSYMNMSSQTLSVGDFTRAGDNIYYRLQDTKKQAFNSVEVKLQQGLQRILAFKSDLAQQAYQTNNQIAYRMSDIKNNIPKTPSVGNFTRAGNNIYCRLQDIKENAAIQIAAFGEKISDSTSRNIYSRIDAGKSIVMFPLKVGEKFGEAIVNIPMGIGDGIEKGFEKSDLVLNSSLRKTNLAIQNSFDDFSNGIAALLPVARNDDLLKFQSEGDNIYCRLQDTLDNFSKGVLVFFEKKDKETDGEKEFGRVAGASDSVEENVEVNLQQKKMWKVSFQNFKNNIYLAISDARDAFKRGFKKGIILCRTTLTIQSGDKKIDEKISDKFVEQNQTSENQNQEAVQKSLEGDDTDSRLIENAKNENIKTKNGLVVLPAPESEEEKEKLKEKIEKSFSDEVEVKPEDAASGIITPVFRERKGDDYFYLMVPVRE